METLHIEIRSVGQTTILDVSGDIDLASSPRMRKALLEEVREKRSPRVVLNFSKVTYIDSSGVASLVEGLKALLMMASASLPSLRTCRRPESIPS